jgi:fibronectin-binding autotransporter adhesin
MNHYLRIRQPQGTCLPTSPRPSPRHSRREQRATGRRPWLELLERREVLSATIFTVDSPGSGVTGSGTSGTLPYVIAQADANTNAAGSEIEFDSSVFSLSSPQTITLGATLVLSETAAPEVIDGPGADVVTVSGGSAVQVFDVDSGVTASISGLTIANGNAPSGGGIDNSANANLTISDCLITSNDATDNDGGGGGIVNFGTLNLGDTTLTNNNASNSGGGVDNEGSATLTNCTVSGNTGGNSGGLGNYRTLMLTDCTISGNSAGGGSGGGGLFDPNTGAIATLTDTIIAGNVNPGGAPDDINGFNATDVTGSYNLIGTGGSGGIVGGTDGNIVLSSLSGLGLAPLGDYGGPTETMALLPGSAAIGMGTAVSGITTDERGFSLDTPPDIGAFQTQTGALEVNTTADGVGSPSGDLSLRQAINLANVLDTAETIAFEPAVFSTAQTITLTDGDLVLSNTTAPVAIDGPGAGLLSVSGNNASVVFFVSNDAVVSMSGLSIIDGNGVFGGGLYSDGVLTITNTTFAGNSGLYGGALYSRAGGSNPLDGFVTLTGDTFTGNSATALSGAIDNWAGGSVTVTDGTFTGNSAPAGGAIGNEWGSVAVSDSTFSNNSASTGAGGAIINYNPNDDFSNSLSVVGSTISGNAAVNGGGIANGGPDTLSLTNDTIAGNSVTGTGGGLYDYGTATLSGCTISGNSANDGGGLYNTGSGTATLTDTIVAGNTGGDGPSDISGSQANQVTGSFNLVGTGGSGGLVGGTNGNIVLTDLAGLGLIPLGDFGGPTQTMALLPGSPAIGAGTAISGITTDQRGAPRPTSGAVDIGAFQDQGYTVAVSSGSAQSAIVSQAFNAPLVALLTENFADAPLPGATIDFSAPSSGASATLSAGSAVTDANGLASVTATANATAGTYGVTASAADVTAAAYKLTNQIGPIFSGLTGQTVTYGSTLTFKGTLAAGAQVPDGEEVAVTVDGITHDAEIGSDGSFSTQFAGADVVLNASSTAYNVAYTYSTDGVFLKADGSSQLTVNPAPLTITAVSETKAYDGTTSSSRTPTYTTLYNGDTVTGLTQAFTSKNVLGTSGSTLMVTGYTINDGNGGKDYTVTTQHSPGTITPAALTITATSGTKVYDGTTRSSQTPTYSTLYGGDTVTGLTQAFTSKNVLGTSGSTLMVTGYTINDGNGGKDYTVITETATGTITPAPLTVRANNVSTLYGSPPALTDTITGFAGGDNSSVVSGAPVLATTVTAGANAGAYPITIAAGTLSATNYIFPAADLIAGTLTVKPAPLVITAVSTSMIAGQPVPTLTAVYSGFKNGETPASLTVPPSLHSTVSPSSAPGNYLITAGGASSPNYTITYVPGTLTVILAPATVESVSVEKVKLSKHKTVQEIVLQFSEALDSATAQSINSYILATAPKNKKQKSKPVPVSSASYNPSALTVRLVTRKKLALYPPLELTVRAASLLDALGRELDGNDSGRSGTNFTAVLSKAGTSVTSARALAQKAGVSSHAVNAV